MKYASNICITYSVIRSMPNGRRDYISVDVILVLFKFEMNDFSSMLAGTSFIP
jgi:hypothetical protein